MTAFFFWAALVGLEERDARADASENAKVA